ncbi:MAG: 4Fe-4S dicluster domain-containing protein [Planctomycetes bacterium]|nr:4Fe-4S dicluster domain-containing protein [Planctomycetota bacterium]
MTDKQTIKSVVKRHLCTGCGTCVGVCPRGALTMVLKKGVYVPRRDRKRCNRCGLCHEVCPGHSVDFRTLSVDLFGEIPEDVALGRYLGCYVGHAMDEAARCRGASGGLVSTLLVFALEEGLIDGAIVTRMRADDPSQFEPFIARTPEEILAAACSQYGPVATNTLLQEILAGDDRVAVVGLPCQIQGIRKAERRIPKLARQIRYRIGLACRHRQFDPHTPWRCTLCSDMLGELSDLTCGEVWLPESVPTEPADRSFVVSRTSEAEELLEYAAAMEAVELSELELPDLLASEGDALFQRRKLPARMRLCRLVGRPVPVYRQELLPPTRADYLQSLRFYATRYVLSGRHPILRLFFRSARRQKHRAPEGHLAPVEAARGPRSIQSEISDSKPRIRNTPRWRRDADVLFDVHHLDP